MHKMSVNSFVVLCARKAYFEHVALYMYFTWYPALYVAMHCVLLTQCLCTNVMCI